MTEEATNAARRRRVQRLKKIILFVLITLLLIPIVLCMFLFIRIQRIEKQLEELRELVVNQQEKPELPAGAEDVPRQESVDVEVKNTYTVDRQQEAETEILTEDVRKVYLTFDDGPSKYTNDILDILAQYDVKATFFVVGKTDAASKAAYERIVEEGHTLGMHSYSHKYNEIYQSVDTYAQDLGKLQEFLYETTGVWSRYTRFPGGSSNQVSQVDMKELIVYLNEQGIKYYDWNISSKDAAKGYTSAQSIVDNVMQDIEKYDTAIVLMHDTADKATTVEALPILIEKIKALDDTKILAIDDETVPVQHRKVTE